MKKTTFGCICCESPATGGNIVKFTIIMAFLCALSSCMVGEKKMIISRQYALEYQSPVFNSLPRLGDVIQVNRFSIAQAYNTKMMVYRSGPYKYGDDAYNRWKVNPADMVTDSLLRDMRNAGLFKAVFSYLDGENARYTIGGIIEEFFEKETLGNSQAVLSLSVSLLDTRQTEVDKTVVFQKSYRVVETLDRENSESLARAMSRAMEMLSKQIITDAYQAIRQPAPPLKQ